MSHTCYIHNLCMNLARYSYSYSTGFQQVLNCPGIIQVSDVLVILLSSQICCDSLDLKVATHVQYTIKWD